MESPSFTRRTPWTKRELLKGECGEKKSEGLKQGCLAKGSKAGTGGKVAKMMIAITHGKGVLICERYEKNGCAIFYIFYSPPL